MHAKNIFEKNAKERDVEDNINMDLKETGYEGVDWIYLIQEREHWRTLVNKIMNIGGSTASSPNMGKCGALSVMNIIYGLGAR
jgi:hypothetical protein